MKKALEESIMRENKLKDKLKEVNEKSSKQNIAIAKAKISNLSMKNEIINEDKGEDPDVRYIVK